MTSTTEKYRQFKDGQGGALAVHANNQQYNAPSQELLFNTSDKSVAEYDRNLRIGKAAAGTQMSLYSAGNERPNGSNAKRGQDENLRQQFELTRPHDSVPNELNLDHGALEDVVEPLTPSRKYISYMSDTNEKGEQTRQKMEQNFTISPQGMQEHKPDLSQNNKAANKNEEHKQSSDELSRASFQRINLVTGSGQRQNHTIAMQKSQIVQNEVLEENLNIQPQGWSFETLNKILYGLLQQIELVKYILQDQKGSSKWQEAGKRIIETIVKTGNAVGSIQAMVQQSRQQRTQIHSIDNSSVHEIFVMINNFAVLYMQNHEYKHAYVLLQCAIQINRNYHNVTQNAQLTSALYRNLSLYHLNLKQDQREGANDQQSSRYIDGAIIANNRGRNEAETSASAQLNGQDDFKIKIQNDIDLAISLNNKAVIELKRGNQHLSREFATKSVETMEPRVFGMINSGLVSHLSQQHQQMSETQQIFQNILQVLLIGYFNLGMSRDNELQSRNIYLQGMQLCFQYLPGGTSNPLYMKFHKKYSRKMYEILAAAQQQQQQSRGLQQLDPNQQLPEILPLVAIQEEPRNERFGSTANQHFNQAITLNLAPRTPEKSRYPPTTIPARNFQPAQPAQAPNGDTRSFTILGDSTGTRMTHRQNQKFGQQFVLPRNLDRCQESVASMPPVQYGDFDPNVHNGKGSHGQYISKMTSSMNQHPIQKEKSEIIQKNPNLSNLDGQRHEFTNVHQPKQQHSGPSDTLELSGASKEDLGLRLPMNSSGRVEQNSKRDSNDNPKSPITADVPNQRFDQKDDEVKNVNKDIARCGTQAIPHVTLDASPLCLEMRMTSPTRLNQGEQHRSMNMNDMKLNGVATNNLFAQQSEPPMPNKPNVSNLELQTPPAAPKKSDMSSLHENNSVDLGRTAKFGNTPQQPNHGQFDICNTQAINDKDNMVTDKDKGAELQMGNSNEVQEVNLNKLQQEMQDKLQAQMEMQQQMTQQLQVEMQKQLASVSQMQMQLQEQMLSQINNFKMAQIHELDARQKDADEQVRTDPQLPKSKIEMAEGHEGQDKTATRAQQQQKEAGNSNLTAPNAKAGEVLMSNPGASGVQASVNASNQRPDLLSASFVGMAQKPEQNQSQDLQVNIKNINEESKQFGQKPSEKRQEARINQSSKCNSGVAKTMAEGLPAKKEQQSKAIEVPAVIEPSTLHVDKDASRRPTLSQLNVTNASNQNLEPTYGSHTQKSRIKSEEIQRDANDFQYEKLNEQDEKDLGFDDLVRQHRSLFENKEQEKQFFVMTLEHLLQNFDSLEDDPVRNQFFIDNLQNQQDSTFQWNVLQKKALFFLREHHRLYSPQNICKFNEKLMNQIKQEKTMTCSKVVTQQHVIDGWQYFMVFIRVEYTDMQQQSSDEAQRELNMMANEIKVNIYAVSEQKSANQPSQESEKVTLSFLELQTVLYMMSNLNTIDPCSRHPEHFGSVPFYHLDTFEDLCRYVLFSFVEIQHGENNNSINVDFMEKPQGLLLKPARISFLVPDSIHVPNDNDIEQIDLMIAVHQSDQVQGQSPFVSIEQQERDQLSRLQAQSHLNCDVNIYHINDKDFKIVISPSFDLQTLLLRRSLQQSNNQNRVTDEELEMTQPENICQIMISLQFDTHDLASSVFKKIQADKLKFKPSTNENSSLIEACEPIKNSQNFYTKYFKKYIDELELILKEEYKEFFASQVDEELQPEAQHSHQKLFELVINKKIACIQLRIEQKVENEGAEEGANFVSKMYVVLKDFELQDVENRCNRPAPDQPQPLQNEKHNLKFICMYTSADGGGTIQRAVNSHEISLSSLSQQYGQDIELGYHSLLCHYTLAQLCQLHLQTMSLQLQEGSASESGSSLGSKSMSDSDLSSSSMSESAGSKSSQKKASPSGETVGKLSVGGIHVQHYMRKVVVQNAKPIVLTASTLVCKEAKKILGVKVVAYDAAQCHGSGIFFSINQSKWAKPPTAKTSGGEKSEQDFTANYSVIQLMKDCGFAYLLDHCINFENHKTVKGKVTIRLKEPDASPTRLRAQEHSLSVLEPAARERILVQMPPDFTTLTYLERYLTQEKCQKLLEQKSRI